MDRPKTQAKFAEKLDLPFPLLCDADKSLAKAYGVLGFGFTSRVTFLIDKQGTIRKVWKKVKPAGHASEVIEALRSL